MLIRIGKLVLFSAITQASSKRTWMVSALLWWSVMFSLLGLGSGGGEDQDPTDFKPEDGSVISFTLTK